MNNRDISTPANSPLVDYALKGLDRCWLPEFGRWSHIYHLDSRNRPNESVPQSDVFYTLNVLLGMARVRRVPRNINLSETFQQNVRHLLTMPVSKYAFGVALWAGAELRLALPDDVLHHIDGMLSDKSQWRSFRAQDLGMIVVGMVAQARVDRRKWRLDCSHFCSIGIIPHRDYFSMRPSVHGGGTHLLRLKPICCLPATLMVN